MAVRRVVLILFINRHSLLTPTWRVAKARSVAESINAAGGRAIAVAGDMLDDAYLKKLVQAAADFGHGKIHIIVNNAGYTWDGVIVSNIQRS